MSFGELCPPWRWPIALACLLACTVGCERPSTSPAAWYDEERALYDGIPTLVRFTPADPRLAAQIWAYFQRIDAVFNDYRPDSEVGRLNGAVKPGRFAVSADMRDALDLARTGFQLSGGTFDITVRPLRQLWREAQKTGVPPDEAQLAAARRAAGFDKIALEGQAVRLAAGIELDFGGVIKGFAVDHAVGLLRQHGVQAALIQMGGETATFGMSARGRPHIIGVRHPDQTATVWTRLIDPGTGLSGSTSGNYERPTVIAGKTFYHIVDPRTGRPANTDVLSASVVFPTVGKNGLADALTKAVVLLPVAESLRIVGAQGGAVLLLLRTAQGGIQAVSSPSWARLVAPEH